MTVKTTTGTVVGISLVAPATFDAAGYGAVAFTPIGEVVNLPEFGGMAEIVSYKPIDTGIVRKLAGSTDQGEISLEFKYSRANPGQALAYQAFKSASKLAYLEVVDAEADTWWMPVIVTSFPWNFSGADDIVSVTLKCAITTNDAGIGIVTSFV